MPSNHLDAQNPSGDVWCQRAAQITSGCATQYDKARAIFDWEAHNIAYDVSFSIRDAETAWQQKKGVCQAYSDIFVLLAECCGLTAKRVTGVARNSSSSSSTLSHSWVRVQTEKGWILLDPTWGAGNVNGNKFEKVYKPYWFDVDPWWFFFSHYPDNPEDQQMPKPLARVMYDKLPYLTPTMSWWGWNSETTLQYYWSRQTEKPPVAFTLTDEWMNSLQVSEVPFFGELQVGYKYVFKIKSLNDNYMVVLSGSANKDIFGDFSAGAQIVPTSSGTLVIGIYDQTTNMVHDLLEYRVVKK